MGEYQPFYRLYQRITEKPASWVAVYGFYVLEEAMAISGEWKDRVFGHPWYSADGQWMIDVTLVWVENNLPQNV